MAKCKALTGLAAKGLTNVKLTLALCTSVILVDTITGTRWLYKVLHFDQYIYQVDMKTFAQFSESLLCTVNKTADWLALTTVTSYTALWRNLGTFWVTWILVQHLLFVSSVCHVRVSALSVIVWFVMIRCRWTKAATSCASIKEFQMVQCHFLSHATWVREWFLALLYLFAWSRTVLGHKKTLLKLVNIVAFFCEIESK